MVPTAQVVLRRHASRVGRVIQLTLTFEGGSGSTGVGGGGAPAEESDPTFHT